MDKPVTSPKTTINGPMHTALKHDSAHKHVTGTAEYIDDIAEPAGTLHGALGLSDRAHAELVSVDLEAVRNAPGVIAVLKDADVVLWSGAPLDTRNRVLRTWVSGREVYAWDEATRTPTWR